MAESKPLNPLRVRTKEEIGPISPELKASVRRHLATHGVKPPAAPPTGKIVVSDELAEIVRRKMSDQ